MIPDFGVSQDSWPILYTALFHSFNLGAKSPSLFGHLSYEWIGKAYLPQLWCAYKFKCSEPTALNGMAVIIGVDGINTFD